MYKKIEKSVICVLLMIFCLAGCKNNKSPEFVYISDTQELDNLMKMNDTFVVQISKSTCYYCDELNKVEGELQRDVLIYKYVIDDKTTEEDIEHLKDILDPFEYAPVFYFIKNSKIEDYLVINDWDKPLFVLSEWVDSLDDY